MSIFVGCYEIQSGYYFLVFVLIRWFVLSLTVIGLETCLKSSFFKSKNIGLWVELVLVFFHSLRILKVFLHNQNLNCFRVLLFWISRFFNFVTVPFVVFVKICFFFGFETKELIKWRTWFFWLNEFNCFFFVIRISKWFFLSSADILKQLNWIYAIVSHSHWYLLGLFYIVNFCRVFFKLQRALDSNVARDSNTITGLRVPLVTAIANPCKKQCFQTD